MFNIESFVRDPSSIKDPIDLTTEIEKQSLEVRYHSSNQNFEAAKAKSEFVLQLATRLDELLSDPSSIKFED